MNTLAKVTIVFAVIAELIASIFLIGFFVALMGIGVSWIVETIKDRKRSLKTAVVGRA